MPVPFEPTPPQHQPVQPQFGGLRSQSAGGTTAWQYRPPERDLVAGRMALMRRQNDPYMQQSKQGAMELANARGQMNSDYAAGAAQRAAIDAALPIAAQDSDTLTKVGLANSEGERRLIEIQMEKDAMAAAANARASGPVNNFAEVERGYAHELQMQRERLAFEGEQGGLGRGHDYGMGLMGIEGDLFGAQMGYGNQRQMAQDEYGFARGLADQGYGHSLGLAEQGYGHNLGLGQQGYNFDLGRMGAQHGYNMDELGQGYQYDLGRIGAQGDTNIRQSYYDNLFGGQRDQLGYNSQRLLARDGYGYDLGRMGAQYGYNSRLSSQEADQGLLSDYLNNQWGGQRDINQINAQGRMNIYTQSILQGMQVPEFMANPEALMGFIQFISGSQFDDIFGGSAGGNRGRGG